MDNIYKKIEQELGISQYDFDKIAFESDESRVKMMECLQKHFESKEEMKPLCSLLLQYVATYKKKAPDAAPDATRLPEDMNGDSSFMHGELEFTKTDAIDDMNHQASQDADGRGGVGVMIIKNGRILVGKRMNDKDFGKWGSPGGHTEWGESPSHAAIRESQEEFGVTPKNLFLYGIGEKEENGIAPCLYVCTEYEGIPECDEEEMMSPSYESIDDLMWDKDKLFKPFCGGLQRFINVFGSVENAENVVAKLTDGAEKGVLAFGKRRFGYDEKEENE